MAKTEIDKRINALIDLKRLHSHLKSLSYIIAYDFNDNQENIVYMVPQDDMHDCFTILEDSDLISAAKIMKNRCINLVDITGFNKALKKTKTIISDNWEFTTEGYNETLIIPEISDYRDITKQYRKLFKDKTLTNNVFNTNSWVTLGDQELEILQDGELLTIIVDTGGPILISKALFGNIKKTIGIHYSIVEINKDSDIVILFRQMEEGYSIYHLMRFLIGF